MGASGWDCVVPYQEDVSAAPARAQEKTFHEGDYYWPHDGRWGGPALPRPASVDELWQDPDVQESGTHSILDVRIEDVRPVSSVLFRELLGSQTPTRADYDRAEHMLFDLVDERNTACYVVLYQDGRPSEIAFFGISGD